MLFCRLELDNYKDKNTTISMDTGDNVIAKDVPQFFKEIPENLSPSELEIINNLNQHLLNVLQVYLYSLIHFYLETITYIL